MRELGFIIGAIIAVVIVIILIIYIYTGIKILGRILLVFWIVMGIYALILAKWSELILWIIFSLYFLKKYLDESEA